MPISSSSITHDTVFPADWPRFNDGTPVTSENIREYRKTPECMEREEEKRLKRVADLKRRQARYGVGTTIYDQKAERRIMLTRHRSNEKAIADFESKS